MDKYSEAEMKMNYFKYLETNDPEYLYKAKEIAKNWNDNDSNEGKDVVQKVLRLEHENEMSM